MKHLWLASALFAATLIPFPALAQESAPAAPETPPAADTVPDTADAPAADTGPAWRHGVSLMGDVKYPAGFEHYDFVNVDAPKGGRVRLGTQGTFDSLNPFIVQGNAAGGVSTHVLESLMADSVEEPATMYGLIAEAIRYPDDFAWVEFRLDPRARWHDGEPITTDDVLWSLEILKKINPSLQRYYNHVTGAEAVSDTVVRFTFDQPGNRELPQIVGQLPVLPKHWWEGTDGNGRQRDVTRPTLERPLGSGLYRIKDFTAGRAITFERVPDAWAADLPVNRGQHNFDEIRYDYYRDGEVLFEAFRGGQIDFRQENSASRWATGYDFPARREGRVVVEEFKNESYGLMQAFVLNQRRPQFQDVRVRRALNMMLDFEEMNRILFHNQYQRITSYFHGTELASSGLPEGLEAEILETVRDQVPPEVFTTPFANPGGTPGDEGRRADLREAQRLLAEAGWTVRREEDPDAEVSFFSRALSAVGLADMPTRPVLRNADGRAFSMEILVDQPSMERVALYYQNALRRLGILVSVRLVDDTQYTERVRNYNYDVIVTGWAQSLSPGNEQRYFWHSEAVDVVGARNLAGIRNPAVDTLIERIIFARDREELVAATRALDRVLLWNFHVVPNWTAPTDRTARWNRFSHPEAMPDRGPLFPLVWWWDEAKAAGTR